MTAYTSHKQSEDSEGRADVCATLWYQIFINVKLNII